MCDQLLLSAAILTHWWQLLASVEALDLLYQTMRTALYRRIAVAIKMISDCGTFFYHCCVCCHPGSRRGNTERVVAR